MSRNRPLPLLFLGMISILLGLAGLTVFGRSTLQSSRCTCSTTATLSNSFLEIHTTRFGFVRSKVYQVSYVFWVDGKEFQGTEKLREEPTSLECTAYYDPRNPVHNQLVFHHNTFQLLVSLILSFGGIYLTLFAKVNTQSVGLARNPWEGI